MINLVNKMQGWLYVLAAVAAVIFWIVTMYGLPPRVAKLEEKVAEHDMQLAEDRVKLNLILGSVTRIESFILQRHAGGK